MLLVRALFYFSILFLVSCSADKPQNTGYWITNISLISAQLNEVAEHQHVHIENGKITEITDDALRTQSGDSSQNIDGTGQYLIPGLIDSHVHLGEIPGMLRDHEQNNPDLAKAMRMQIPRAYLYYGFTTLVDLNDNSGAVKRWNKARVRPDAYSCGPALMIANGYPSHFVPQKFRYRAMPNFIYDSRQAERMPKGIKPPDHTPEAAIMRAKDAGAVCIKVFVEGGFGPDRGKLPMFTPETLKAIVTQSHKAGLPVIVHANAYKAQKMAMDAGADMLAHGLWHWRGIENSKEAKLPVEVKELLKREALNGIGLQSTIQTLYGQHGLFDDDYLDDPALLTVLPAKMIDWYASDEGRWFSKSIRGDKPAPEQNPLDPVLSRLKNTVAYLAANQAHFLFGSDTPSGPTYANPPGLNGYRELQNLAAFGISPAQIFRSVTLDNARAFGLDNQIGTIEVGKTANLLLLGANPLQSTKAYDEIKLVVLHGKPINRAALLAN